MITGILLAAGRGRRFGSHKLIHPLTDGMPLLIAALRNLRQGVDEVLVVVRPDDDALLQLLAQEAVRVVACPEAERGMGASLACGVRASADVQGWLIALGDMPAVPPGIIRTLSDRLRSGAAIVAPVYQGRRGHPVGFSHAFFPFLSKLDGDSGARHIIEAHADRLELVTSSDGGILLDVDTRADFEDAMANRV